MNWSDSFGLSFVSSELSRLDGSRCWWDRAPDGLERGDSCGTSGTDDDEAANVVNPLNGRTSSTSSTDTILTK